MHKSFQIRLVVAAMLAACLGIVAAPVHAQPYPNKHIQLLVSYAPGGTGELLKLKTKGNLVHVPYKGAAPALNDLVGGHVDFYFPGFPAAASLVQSGQLKILAVSSAKRTAAAPDVPTVAETAGIPNFNFILWVGFFAPNGTPPEIVARLNSK